MVQTRREQLLRAAVDYVAGHGISDLSLRQLGAALGTSHRMLVYHFGSKEGLLVAVVREVEQQQRAALADLGTDPDLSPVEQGLRLLGRGDDEHLRLRGVGAQVLEHGHAAHPWHGQVEHDDVGLELAGEPQALLAVVGLADDLQAGIGLQRGGESLADQREVVDQEEADVHANVPSVREAEASLRSARARSGRSMRGTVRRRRMSAMRPIGMSGNRLEPSRGAARDARW